MTGWRNLVVAAGIGLTCSTVRAGVMFESDCVPASVRAFASESKILLDAIRESAARGASTAIAGSSLDPSGQRKGVGVGQLSADVGGDKPAMSAVAAPTAIRQDWKDRTDEDPPAFLNRSDSLLDLTGENRATRPLDFSTAGGK